MTAGMLLWTVYTLAAIVLIAAITVTIDLTRRAKQVRKLNRTLNKPEPTPEQDGR